MHAVFITFRSSADLDDLAGPFTEYAHRLESVRGLAFKTWLRDGATLGGFHVFTDRSAADAYMGSEMVATLTANATFSGVEVRHFAVLEELSRITGTPHRATR
jgi:hypothetical protein